MTTFKHFHDGESPNLRFHYETQVFFCQCDANHNLSLCELLKILSDAAVEDFNQRVMSYSILEKNNWGILVSRQSFRFHKMPVAEQAITIHTWEEKPEPLQFVRAYEIVDTKSGEKLVSGLSTWLLVNLQTRRLSRIKEFTMREEPTAHEEHDVIPPGKITGIENMQLLCERPIWYSDIDGNGHTNNARYGAFVVDAIGEKYQTKKFKDFRINYSQEAVLGQKIALYGAFDDENKKITVIGKQENTVCFEAELYYV